MSRFNNAGASLLVCLAVVLLPSCRLWEEPAADEDEIHTIAFLRAVVGTRETDAGIVETLRQSGFTPGRNLRVLASDPEEVYTEPEAVAAAVDDWVAEGVDLIVAFSTSGAMAANAAAPNVDILFLANDPLASGLVEDEQAPNGRMTGVTFRVPADRTLDVARRALPGLDEIGLAYPTDDPAAEAHKEAVLAAGKELGIHILLEAFVEPADVADSIAELSERGADALLVSNSPAATRVLDLVEVASTEAGLPVIANSPVAPWALISLYPDTQELGQQLGRQAVRLLNGSSPAAVPVEDPRRYLLVLNAEAGAEHGIHFTDELIREAAEVTPP